MKFFRALKSNSCLKIPKFIMLMIGIALLGHICMFALQSFIGIKYKIVSRVERLDDSQSSSIGEIRTFKDVTQTLKTVIKTQKEMAQTPKSVIKTQTETIQTPKSVIKTQTETIQTPKSVIKTQKETIQTPKSVIKTQTETIQTPKTAIKMHKEMAQRPKSVIKTQKEMAQRPKTIINTHKEKIQTPKTVIKMNKEVAQTPKAMVKTVKARRQTPKHVDQMSKWMYQKRRNMIQYRNISKYFQLSKFDQHDRLLNLQFNYLINLNKCHQKVFALAFVHSSVDKWLLRNRIRTTWGGYKGFNGKYFRTIFMLGKPPLRTLQPAIVREAKEYNDIVQGDFDDTYKNLTYKHIMGHAWITENCPNVSYIIKTDDDVMVNVYNMMEYLNNTKPVKNCLYCYVLWNESPHRNNHSKWAMSTFEYPFTKYPEYCEGFAYIATTDVSAKLVKISENTKFFWIDDVFITGILTLRTKLQLKPMVANHGHAPMNRLYIGPGVRNLTFLVVRTPHTSRYWNSTWQAILKYSRN